MWPSGVYLLLRRTGEVSEVDQELESRFRAQLESAGAETRTAGVVLFSRNKYFKSSDGSMQIGKPLERRAV